MMVCNYALRACAAVTGLEAGELIGRSQRNAVIIPRCAIYLILRRAGLSYAQIGRGVGKRDHTTILNAIRNHGDALETKLLADKICAKMDDKEFMKEVESCLTHTPTPISMISSRHSSSKQQTSNGQQKWAPQWGTATEEQYKAALMELRQPIAPTETERPSPQKNWTYPEISRAKSMRKSGLTLKQIGNALGRSPAAVKGQLDSPRARHA